MVTTHKVVTLQVKNDSINDDGVWCPLNSYLDRQASKELLLVSLCVKPPDEYLAIFRTEF